MIIGVPKEVKDRETRVGLTPGFTASLTASGHEVLVETHAGDGISASDCDYSEAGARIASSAAEVWGAAELLVKVKEPQPSEYPYLRSDLLLFTFLHLAPLRELTEKLLELKVTSVAYETVREKDGSLPILTPMSEVAGRLAVQVGAHYLEASSGGRGLLLGGVPGVAPAEVVILGGGNAGNSAAKIAVGMGAHVTILDRSLNRLRELDDIYNGRVTTLASNPATIRRTVIKADLMIGTVLIPGAATPRLVSRDMIAAMKPGSVVVDVSVDQGGCFETSRPTTHTDPVYVVDGVLHYCVSNMPAAVPHTSNFSLVNATFPYLLELADNGLKAACRSNGAICQGVNTYKGSVTHRAVAESQNRSCVDVTSLF